MPSSSPRAESRRIVRCEEASRVRPRELERSFHPRVGSLELARQSRLDPGRSHRLVHTAVPASKSHAKQHPLSVVGPKAPA